jgi:hypothetical protein
VRNSLIRRVPKIARSTRLPQPELLGEDGEDEVDGAFGHEAELALQTVQPALSEQPARADRDPCLEHVVSGTQRILVGIEKDLEPAPLVRDM